MELLTTRAGSVNIIVWQSVLKKFHRKALGSSILAVYGVWQRAGEVRHLVANRLVDVSTRLGELPTAGRNFC
jgi:error-prone DNA polymerase